MNLVQKNLILALMGFALGCASAPADPEIQKPSAPAAKTQSPSTSSKLTSQPAVPAPSIAQPKIETPSKKPLDMEVKCEDGTTREGFLAPVKPSSAVSCPRAAQNCIAGRWVGPTLYETCDTFTKDCEGFPHGTVVTGFISPTSQPGFPCVPATKSCTNGVWTGPQVFSSCSEIR